MTATDGAAEHDPAKPFHLRRRLLHADRTPGTAVVDGAVLLSDVVAFTSHVEALSGLGRAAVEEFSLGMAGYVTRAIEVVLAHGGDVLDIAGDSLLCLWDATELPGGIRDAVARAASAAVAIQAAVTGHELGAGRVVQTRIGLAAGPVQLTVAGGVGGDWALVAHGDTVARVEDAERECPPGRVCTDAAVARILAADAGFMPLAAELHVLTELDRPLTPDPLPPAGGDGVGLWDMGLRRLSLAIVRVDGLHDPAGERGQEIVRLFQQVVAEREGAGSLITDNKGVRLLATFGAPPRAHEDDPARAVDAVRAFAELLAAEGGSCSAGVATGRLVHGRAGTAQRRTTTMAGEVINVAARLSTAANRSILCDQETAVAAHARYAFAVMNPIMVKGKSQPVPVFEPVAPVRGQLRAITMRGRAAELAALTELASRPGGSGRRVAVVVGEAGMGKSTLVGDVIDRLTATRRRAVVARTDAIDRTTPFLAWTGFVSERLGIRERGHDTTHEAITVAARAALSPHLAAHAGAIASVFGRAAAGGGANEHDEPATVLPELIADLVAGGAGPEAVVVFDDAHWADSGSLTALDALAQRADAPPIIVTTRPEGIAALARLTAPGDVDVIELSPLDRDAVVQIAVDRLGTDRVPPSLVAFLLERTSGNPYFCDQTLRSLIERGSVVVNGRSVTHGDLSSAGVPATVEGVIVSRLDQLDAEAQHCLRVAAVVGTRHDIAVVGACLAAVGTDVDVHAVFEHLGPDGLVRRADDRHFQFQHVIARDVVYDLMTEAQRRRLHAVAASHLEAHPGTAGAATIGRHWRAAGDHGRALGHLEQAAADALAAGSFASATAVLDEIDALVAEGGLALGAVPQARLAVQRARAAYYLGLFTDARASLERVVGLIGAPLPGTDEERIAEYEARERARSGGSPDRGAVEHDEQLDPEIDALLFETYRTLVKVLYLLGENGHLIVAVALRALSHAEHRGQRLDAASIQAMASGAYAAIGNVALMERHADEAIAVALSDDGAAVANHVWRMLAVARAAAGQWSASLDASDRALAALDPEGQNRDGGIWQTRAAVLLCAGDFVGAEDAWRRTAAIAAHTGNARLARWSRLDEIQTLVGRGEIDAADALLTATVIELGPPTDPLGTIEQHYTTALVRSAQRRHAEAVREARAVMRMVEAAPPSGFHWVEFCAGAAEAMAQALYDRDVPPAVEPGALLAELGSVIALMDGFGSVFPHVVPRAALLRAIVAERRGDAGVDDAFALAHRLALAGGYEYDAARCVVLAALVRHAHDSLPSVAEAGATLERLGATPWVERARRAAERPVSG